MFTHIALTSWHCPFCESSVGEQQWKESRTPPAQHRPTFTLWNFQDLRLRATISPREFCHPISRLYNVSVQLQYSFFQLSCFPM